ncbi:MAG TPA: zf-HC2 domain-containing protein [Vicinamibacterales bacterium]|nr:zf-HC2 domain-containing protein [Vicinamibacterales bacterium]
MSVCTVQDAGTIELYFYGELEGAERARIDDHLRQCRECSGALEELKVIRVALSARPDVSGPPSGDWSVFMQRLDDAVRSDAIARVPVPFKARTIVPRRPFVRLLASAALLAIVAISVFFASQAGRRTVETDGTLAPARIAGAVADDDAAPIQAGLAAVGARHFERSKLVVLGLAAKDPGAGESSDWAYERELATSLLNDTRLYRMAAEQRGLTSLAGVMRDLELVLLQTSMAEATDDSALPQIQRLIRKRGLVQKMDVVGTTGLVP